MHTQHTHFFCHDGKDRHLYRTAGSTVSLFRGVYRRWFQDAKRAGRWPWRIELLARALLRWHDVAEPYDTSDDERPV